MQSADNGSYMKEGTLNQHKNVPLTIVSINY